MFKSLLFAEVVLHRYTATDILGAIEQCVAARAYEVCELLNLTAPIIEALIGSPCARLDGKHQRSEVESHAQRKSLCHEALQAHIHRYTNTVDVALIVTSYEAAKRTLPPFDLCRLLLDATDRPTGAKPSGHPWCKLYPHHSYCSRVKVSAFPLEVRYSP